MKIHLEPVTESEEILREIFDFEKENKDYFETMLPARPMEYQHFESFRGIMTELIEEQNRNEFLMFLIRSEGKDLVGRINSTVKQDSADIGYRISLKYQGLGYASQAVNQLLKIFIEEFNLKEITAGTAKENYASRRVLEKSGFIKTSELKSAFMINGNSVDTVNYKFENHHVTR